MIMRKISKYLLINCLWLASQFAFAQQTYELTKTQNKITELQIELDRKRQQLSQHQQESSVAVSRNKQAALRLTENPTDKRIAKYAKRAAKKAGQELRETEKVQKQISALEARIKSEQNQGLFFRQSNPADLPGSTPQQLASNHGQADTLPVAGKSAGENESVAEKVVKATMDSYPQQPGLPAVIINNIITVPGGQLHQPPTQSDQVQQTVPSGGDGSTPQTAPRSQLSAGSIRTKTSGLWVLAVAGLHASDFKADFADGKAQGRSGWNAGLDFRIHGRRFFVQPGAHYFNSSIDVTFQDSISNAPWNSGPRLQSLKIPFMLGVYLTRAQHTFFKANIKAGGAATYLLEVSRSNFKQFEKQNLKSWSYGLNAGIGLEFGPIALDISHEWGVSSIFKNNKSSANLLRATLGIRF